MRLILTGLAAAIVLALTLALVGPHLIDWSAHRPALEARLSEALGVPARLGAPIEMTLLPAPRLSAGGLSLGSGEGGAPTLEAGAAQFELSAPSLTRGEWRFVEARLEKPVLTLTLDKEGRLIAPAGADLAAAVEAARIAEGTLIVKDQRGGDERLRLEKIDLAFSADGLAGPFKGQGKAGARGLGFRFATGAVQAGKMRLKLALDAGAATPHAEFDGMAQLAGAPHYEGQFAADGAFSLAGGEPTPWRMTATLKADANGAGLDPLDLKIGAEERPLGVSGRASLDGEGARLTLAARQIDLDKALGADGKPATPRQAVAAAVALAERAAGAAGPLSSLPLTVELTPGVVTLGGETIPDAALALTRAAGEAPQIKVEASLPGRTRAKAAGALDGGAAARFRGRIDASTGDARRLRDWLGDLLPEAAQPPFAALSVSAAAEISEVAVSLREARMKLDRTPLNGDVIYVAPVAGERGRLFADLTSDALDIDGAPDLTALAGAAPDHDFSLALDARAVRVARFGEGTLDAGRIRLAARREGGRTELERLSLEGVGGADLKAQGALDAQGGGFSLDLDAQRLGDLAGLIERLAPGRFSAALKARAARLSPAKLTVKAQAGPDFALREASVSGVFAGTRAEGRAGPSEGGIAAHVEIAQDDVATLLRQIGLDTRGPPRLGAARIVADVTTRPGGLTQARAQAQAPGATLAYEGGFLLPALLAGAPQALGVVSLDAENVAPLLTAAGVLAPGGFARGGADVAAQVATTGDGLAFEGLRGWAFGTRVSGAARLVGGGRGRIEGRLAMERLALADVAALALGFPGDAPAKTPWSDRAFAPALGAEAPDVAMAIEAERLDTGLAGETGPARATLTLTPGAARLDALEAPLAGGRLAASFGWRRDGIDASFSGRFGVTGAAFDGAAASGTVDASLDAAASGRNVAALVAALGGEGSARVSGLTLKRAAPGALAAAVKGVEAQTISLELGSLERALAERLDAGERRVPAPVETTLTLATGVVRAAPVALDAPQERLAASAALDLRSMTLEIREAAAAKASPTHWAGTPPAFEAIWRGPVAGAMERAIEAGALLNGLSARSLALELERVEALEADIAERAMFARRQKAWEFMRRREREIADYVAEQARLAELARAESARREQARRAEEARRALEAQRAEDERRAEEARKAEEARRAEERRRIEDERRAEATRREMQRALDALRIDAPLAGEVPLKGEAPLDAPR